MVKQSDKSQDIKKAKCVKVKKKTLRADIWAAFKLSVLKVFYFLVNKIVFVRSGI